MERQWLKEYASNPLTYTSKTKKQKEACLQNKTNIIVLNKRKIEQLITNKI